LQFILARNFAENTVECLPTPAIWGQGVPGQYKCVDHRALYAAGSVTDILTDGQLDFSLLSLTWNYADIIVAILTLPVYNVWKLKMPKGRKIAVIGIFLLGTLVIITGIVRLIYVIDAFSALEQSATADGTCKHSDSPIQS
jgi:hypothetical protein